MPLPPGKMQTLADYCKSRGGHKFGLLSLYSNPRGRKINLGSLFSSPGGRKWVKIVKKAVLEGCKAYILLLDNYIIL